MLHGITTEALNYEVTEQLVAPNVDSAYTVSSVQSGETHNYTLQNAGISVGVDWTGGTVDGRIDVEIPSWLMMNYVGSLVSGTLDIACDAGIYDSDVLPGSFIFDVGSWLISAVLEPVFFRTVARGIPEGYRYRFSGVLKQVSTPFRCIIKWEDPVDAAKSANRGTYAFRFTLEINVHTSYPKGSKALPLLPDSDSLTTSEGSDDFEHL